MTAGTVPSEAAIMNVVGGMTGRAFPGQFFFMRRFHMALLAGQFRVHSIANEARSGMVELPVRPAIRVVAGGTAVA